jgi:ArsR family transcriptional regulator, arsenate/arsenite/antimonite-responsive transcriptional repressor / arsenate reductase (thioredoxin)
MQLVRTVAERSASHAALGDPTRLAIVDELTRSDRSPLELRQLTGVDSNLLSHHLDVLEDVHVIARTRSSGDGRRRYVHLNRGAIADLVPAGFVPSQPALFVCTHNSARSQLAAALWRQIAGASAQSAGTRPSDRVHPGAIAAARRSGLDLTGARPRALAALRDNPALVVTVCDRAHEELDPPPTWLHWSVADPVATPSRAAFDAAVAELRDRITALVGTAR